MVHIALKVEAELDEARAMAAQLEGLKMALADGDAECRRLGADNAALQTRFDETKAHFEARVGGLEGSLDSTQKQLDAALVQAGSLAEQCKSQDAIMVDIEADRSADNAAMQSRLDETRARFKAKHTMDSSTLAPRCRLFSLFIPGF